MTVHWRIILLAALAAVMVGIGACGTGVLPTGPTPVRAFLVRTEAPKPGYGAYGFLLFTRESSPAVPEQYQRDLMACGAYMRGLADIREFSEKDRSKLLPTYWPLSEKPRPSDRCEGLLAKYDIARAKAFLGTVKKLGVKGPVLVAWRTMTPEPTGDALVMDLSNVSNGDLAEAIGLWESHITQDPSVWSNGFKIEYIRFRLREFFQRYSDTLLELIKT